jgi:hypothetical protein
VFDPNNVKFEKRLKKLLKYELIEFKPKRFIKVDLIKTFDSNNQYQYKFKNPCCKRSTFKPIE